MFELSNSNDDYDISCYCGNVKEDEEEEEEDMKSALLIIRPVNATSNCEKIEWKSYTRNQLYSYMYCVR